MHIQAANPKSSLQRMVGDIQKKLGDIQTRPPQVGQILALKTPKKGPHDHHPSTSYPQRLQRSQIYIYIYITPLNPQ